MPTCIIVSHTHWDREWYRTFQAFRARLVDAADRVLDLIASDPGFHFLLDGQAVVLEDYLEIRPQRRQELEEACRAGRIAIGPWYVQPDSLLPCGESHVRNLLEGRRVAAAVGPVSTVAYTPDSFGHPAQLPQVFAGFGLEPFVYWRGNGDEIDRLPAEYLWEAPDGSAVLAHHLSEGYFAASGLPDDPAEAASGLEKLARKLLQRTRNERVLLMNGIDHALPAAHTAAVAAALADATGWTVERGLLEDFTAGLSRTAPRFRGELLGARIANLLPGVWSTRTPLKLRNRRIESLLLGWTEPWSALGRLLGAGDEAVSSRPAWRALLKNQAHDSICGCSQDRVHEQMQSRYDEAEELATQTTARVLERIAGLGAERRTPWSDQIDVAVFNPSPHVRTDVVRFPLDPSSWFETRGGAEQTIAVHPLLIATLGAKGFTVDDRPARLVPDEGTGRVRLIPESSAQDVELVAENVPAFGWKRFRLAPSEPHPDREDDAREIDVADISVRASEDGTFDVRFGSAEYRGLCAIEDVGDRGDTYDFDPVTGGTCTLEDVRVKRVRHATGVEQLEVHRVFSIPAELASDRRHRSEERARIQIETVARLVPGVNRVDLRVRMENTARDHRLRVLFPSGAPVEDFDTATTFDVVRRQTGPRSANGWVHPAPSTFPHQGFVSANGLTVAAPGLQEAEVTVDGVIAITLLRAIGWLSRMDLDTRPLLAGPSLPTPGAQCLQAIEATLSLHPGLDARAVQDTELGLRAVAAGANELAPAGIALLEVSPREILVSALKPAEAGDGMVLRLLNPTDTGMHARVRHHLPIKSAAAVRLDETPIGQDVSVAPHEIALDVPARALRSVLLK